MIGYLLIGVAIGAIGALVAVLVVDNIEYYNSLRNGPK